MRLPTSLNAVAFSFLLIIALSQFVFSVGAVLSPDYWNADGNFGVASTPPYYVHRFNVTDYYAPWGTKSWGIFASSSFANRTGSANVDEYIVNVTGGVAHAWGKEDRRLIGARTGGVALGQGLSDKGAGEYTPSPVSTLGRQTLLIYKIMLENTSISTGLSSIDQDGILFDLFLYSDYTINGTLHRRNFIIDFYVHLECGGLNGDCSQINDTSINHALVGATHIFGWKIHSNLVEGVWVEEISDLTWYLENSLHRAYCMDVAKSESCSLATPEGYIFGLSAATEAFGGYAGFALKYLYLYQSNDCGVLQDAGNDLNHPLRIDDLSPTSFREVYGWLGVGKSFRDADDYYEFNVSNSLVGTNNHLLASFHGADSISLYAPGNLPALRASIYNQSLSLWYNFSSTDPEGYWYLQVHRSSGFGFYSVDIWLGNNHAYGSVPAICSLVAPNPKVETSWPLIAGLAVVTVLVVVSGRIWSRRKPLTL